MQFGRIDLLKKKIKLYLSYPNYRKIFSDLKACTDDCAVLIGTPVHSNLGDHLIAIEALRYIRTRGFGKVVEIPEFAYELHHRRLAKLIPEKAVIFINGGGWMGDTYEDELVIENILNQYCNTVIILPQTTYFEKDSEGVRRLKRLIEKASPIICLREKFSYDFVINRLGLDKNDCLLLPDLALLHQGITGPKRKRVIISLRDDTENIKDEINLSTFNKNLEQLGYQIVMSSSVIAKKVVKFIEREEVVNQKICEFSEADLVITDRLHSMIIAMLAGTKCIALDNLTHKVKGCYELWLSDNPNILFLENTSLLTSELIQNVLERDYVVVKSNYMSYYNLLDTKINEVRPNDK